LKGFHEAERVSREGFVILEGQDSLVVRALAAFGIAENWDPASGYVYRFSRRELEKIFSSLQSISEWRVCAAWLPFGSDVVGLVPAFRRFVYPVISQPLLFKILDTRGAKATFRTLFQIGTSVGGRWGNSLMVVAHKRPFGRNNHFMSLKVPIRQAK